nr:hypothetical protein [Tanacetum cinerariifolium]
MLPPQSHHLHCYTTSTTTATVTISTVANSTNTTYKTTSAATPIRPHSLVTTADDHHRSPSPPSPSPPQPFHHHLHTANATTTSPPSPQPSPSTDRVRLVRSQQPPDTAYPPVGYDPTDHLCLFSGNRLIKTKKEITMAEQNLNEYISIARKNYLSDDNEERMVEKSFLEIQGSFLVKICDNDFNGIVGENVFEHIENFLEVVGPLNIKGVIQDRFRLSVFHISLAGATGEWFRKDCIGSVTTWEDLVERLVYNFYQLSDNNEEMKANEHDDPDDIAKIFKIEGNLFDFETPLCKALNEFNYLLKIDTYLFTLDIQEIKTYGEHKYELDNNMIGDLEKP